jgi:hypothetical protein
MAANTISSFSGLNNVTDPLRLGLGWLSEANNINITDTGAIEKREGFTRVRSGVFSDAYSTLDFQRTFLVESGEIKTLDGTTIYTCTSERPIYWAEENGKVYFNNGVDSGVIHPDYAVLTLNDQDLKKDMFGFSAFKAENKDLEDEDTKQIDARIIVKEADVDHDRFPLPKDTDIIQIWGGRLYACQYFPEDNQTVVWFSEPLSYNLFVMDRDFLIFSGRVLMLAPHQDALIVGTDREVYAYTGEKLAQIADYGVVAGQHWVADGERVLFWSKRGMCSALPLKNLTERQVSMAPGSSASGAIIHSRGQKRYLVTVKQGGAAFNQR